MVDLFATRIKDKLTAQQFHSMYL